MPATWKIIRDDSFAPRPGTVAVVRDVVLAAEPVANDVLELNIPEGNLEGRFLVVRRVIDEDRATVVVRAFEP